MKLNCDMGEGFGRYSFGWDKGIMPHVHMANIACGFHAGDPGVMEETVCLAKEHGVEIGAHPGYPDLQGFGRRNMGLSPREVRCIVLYQTGALDAFCRASGTQLSYVKPHGALYNTMMRDDAVLGAVMDAVKACNPQLRLMLQATARYEHHQEMAAKRGISLYLEAFADRAYEEDGALRNRALEGAVLDGAGVRERVSTLCEKGVIVAITGKELKFPVDSICVHGDNESGVKQIATIRAMLEAK